MNIPKSFIRTRLFEIGRTIISRKREKLVEFYHKKLAWWISVYGVKFKHNGYYIIIKKLCF